MAYIIYSVHYLDVYMYILHVYISFCIAMCIYNICGLSLLYDNIIRTYVYAYICMYIYIYIYI